MTLYKTGKITSLGKKYIIFETNYTGLIIYTPRPKDFIIDKACKLYIYEYRYENLRTIYGFKTIKERILFEDLLSVPGIGPKTSVQILTEPINNIISKIVERDAEALSKMPGLGLKSSKQLIFEIQDKYKKLSANTLKIFDIKPTLKTLGFSNKQILYAIKNVKQDVNPEKMIEEAIKAISNANHQIS